MKRSLVLASLVLGASASQANVLDFGNGPAAPSICSSTSDGLGSTLPCANWDYLLQSYGDVGGVVDVGYTDPRAATATSLGWWSTDYNDLYGVLFSYSGRARIELKPLNGEAVTLTHFDLGAWANTTRDTTVDVFAIGSATPLFTYTGPVGSGTTTHTGFDMSVSSATGLWLEWRDDAYNVGMDNVTFTVGAVPEPSTYAMLLAGLAVCGAVARRRRG